MKRIEKMGDDELLYRSQEDYISKYRTVIEYFDAVKVALTATPALHTSEIFGKPVFNYSYREAVIEGFLIDHDAPHNIEDMRFIEVSQMEEKVKILPKDSIIMVAVSTENIPEGRQGDLSKLKGHSPSTDR